MEGVFVANLKRGSSNDEELGELVELGELGELG